MFFPSKYIVDGIKHEYKKGDRVELVSMNDLYRKFEPGLKGTVDVVDDTGTIHVIWDNGCRLGIIYGEDECRKITEE